MRLVTVCSKCDSKSKGKNTEKKRLLEFFINGKQLVTNFVSYETIKEHLERKGYEMFYETSSYSLYVNREKYRCAILQSIEFTGYYDAKGNKIYQEDVIEYQGMEEPIFGTYPFEGYYIRHSVRIEGRYWPKTTDYYFKNQDDFSKVKKIEDVLNRKKRFWNNSEKITFKEL